MDAALSPGLKTSLVMGVTGHSFKKAAMIFGKFHPSWEHNNRSKTKKRWPEQISIGRKLFATAIVKSRFPGYHAPVMIHTHALPERLDAADLDFLRRLQRRESGTVQDFCDELSVTPTAIRHRLSRLVSAGYVSKCLVRAGRGRPRHEYAITERGLRELGDNYSELAAVLWNVLRGVPDPAVRSMLLQRIEATLAHRYGRGVDAKTQADRIDQLRRRLLESGLDIEVDQSGELPVLRENSCPYFDLAVGDLEICQLEQRVFEQVLGVPVELVQRCVDGHPCCEFQVGVKATGTNPDGERPVESEEPLAMARGGVDQP